MKLFKHQKEAVEFIVSRGGSGAVFHEMGLGKTRTAIEIFSMLRASDTGLKMIVICPISLIDAAWKKDNDRFQGYSFNNLHDNFSFDTYASIHAINFEMVLGRAEKLKEEFKNGPWLCVVDESSKMKNHKAQITKILLKIAPLFKYRIVMSGTPAPNSEMEYWAQMQFVEPGCLGSSMTVFRNYFFQLVNRYTGTAFSGSITSRAHAQEVFRKYEHRMIESRREELMRLILSRSHVAKKKDCLDLPDQIDEIRMIQMNNDQARAYTEMKTRLVTEIRDQIIAAPVALTKLLKLRQITSGFVYNEIGESFEVGIKYGGVSEGDPGTEKMTIKKEFSNPKLKELFDVIDEAGRQPIIIWINFHWEQIKICHELHQKFGEESVVTLSALTKDKDESIKAFQNGRARFLVAHPRSAAHGLTFVNCSLQIFFSLDFSWEAYEQARARIHRAGQMKKCTYVHIIAKDTVDETILKLLKSKEKTQDFIYEMTKK